MQIHFVEECHNQIFQHPDVLNYLSKRGLTQEIIKQFKIGYNATELYLNRIDWGLNKENDKSKIWLPVGIIIPALDTKGNVIRIKVRRDNWTANDELPKYIAVPGSQNGLSIAGKTKNKDVMIVVESELDAIVVAYLISDFGFAVSVGSNLKNPDTLTHYLASQVSYLLTCHDNDNAGKNMFDKWKKLYSCARAYPTPICKDIGEAIEKGFDVRNWILGVLPKQNNVVSNPVASMQDVVVNGGLGIAVNKVENVLEVAVEVSSSSEQSIETMNPITGEIFESASEFISLSNAKFIQTCHCTPFKIVEGKCSCNLRNNPTFLCDVCNEKYCNCDQCKEAHLAAFFPHTPNKLQSRSTEDIS